MLAIVTALYLHPFVCAFDNSPDSGIYLNGAAMVSGGAVPGRDFVELQGPGSFVWLGIFFRLFGATFDTARVVLTGTGVALALLTFWLSRRLGASGFFAAVFVLVMSVPVFPVNNPHYDSSLFVLVALVIFLPAWEKLTAAEQTMYKWRLICSGALCGVATWTLQQKGLYVAIALAGSIVWILRKRAAKPASMLFIAYGAVAILPFLFFAILHSLPDVLYANFVWPLSNYSDTNSVGYGFPIWQNLRTTFAQQGSNPVSWAEDIVLYVPFFVAAFLPWLLPLAARLSAKQWFGKQFVPYWLASYAIWFSELHRLDIGHLRNGALLMATLFFSICEAGQSPWLRRVGLVLTLCVALSGVGHYNLGLGRHTHQTRRGNVGLAKDDNDAEALLNFLATHTRANEEVLVYPYQPIYYFAEQLSNPCRYSNLMYGVNTRTQFLETLRDLERKQVGLIIYDRNLSGAGLSRVFPAYQQPPESQLVLEPYLKTHYKTLQELGRFRVLERLP